MSMDTRSLETTTPRYLNRELSWLEFNQRVLDEARDLTNPPLERLKFLAITASNLDEFFMVRVGGLQILARERSNRRDPSGMTPREQLEAISARTHRITSDQYRCLLEEIEPALAASGVRRQTLAGLARRQREAAERVFENEVYPVLSPIAVSSAADLPLLINKSLNLCVQLHPVTEGAEPRFAVIPLGRSLSRMVTLPSEGGYEYLLLEDMAAMFIERFFPGERIAETVPFRITRNADFAVQEDKASDLLESMKEILDARRVGGCVRLELSDRVTTKTQQFLQEVFEVHGPEVYAAPGPLDLAAFMSLADLPGFDALKNAAWPPQPSPDVDPAASMFEVLAQKDVLLCHPYQSFDPVVRLVQEAAEDPDVLAIKQTLYRTSRESAIVAALARAAQRGKYVTALVELKARFDEARNIEWAEQLEQAGVQVLYGVKGLKTHAKICIIVRREPHGVQRYIHFGTGNYNETTARIYSDISFLTANEELGADATTFFNAITGYSQPRRMLKLEMAPLGLREHIIELIQSETERRRRGQKAAIDAKVNALVDPAIIDALYLASQAGVKVRLNVRGVCCLRPGVPGLSENIEVVSIVDRFLEHARIFHFHHGGDDLTFISSADWMPRNLDGRVELLVPVEDPPLRDRLISMLETYFKDTVKARRLLPDGSYEPAGRGKRKKFRSQEVLFREALSAVKQAKKSRRTTFEPHRAGEETA
jgi:polyphosphate kinase